MAGAPIDVSGYRNWQQIRTPEGGVLYAVPDSEWAYDPILSQSKGRSVFRKNPKPALDEQERIRKLQEQQADPVNQLIPVVGGAAGTVGAAYLANSLANSGTAASTGAQVGGAAANALSGAGTAATGANAVSTGAQVAEAVTPIGTAVNGGTLMSNGSVIPAANSGLSSGLQSLGVGAQTANIASQYAIPGLGVALGGYNMYNELKAGDLSQGEGFVNGAGIGAGIGTMILPGVGTVIGAGVGALAGFLTSKFGNHKSTRQYARERWGKLAEDGVAGAEAAYSLNHPKSPDGSPTDVWSDGKYAGQKWTMEKALDLVKEDPKHFYHVYGNYKTFGNDWNNYTDEQRGKIVSRLASEGLYKSDKGDVLISNEDKARKIKDEVLGTGAAAPTTQSQGEKLAALRNQRIAVA